VYIKLGSAMITRWDSRAIRMTSVVKPLSIYEALQTAAQREAIAAAIRERVKQRIDKKHAKETARAAAAAGKSAAGPRGRMKDGLHGDRIKSRDIAKAGADEWRA
jgi:hypothetical protein